MSKLSRNICLQECPPVSGLISPLHSNQINHVTLTQASRPSTTSENCFADGKSSEIIIKHRVVVMGSAFVGKTQIISQFLYDKFCGRYRQTIEELHRAEYCLPNLSSLTLDILDTSGSISFPAMQALSISTSNAFILVFSVDSEESWNEVIRLREKIIKKRGQRVPMVICCNKIDLPLEQHQCRREITEAIVKYEWECGYVETSAKDNINIINVFKELLSQANIKYNLSPAVRRRRKSLPCFSTTQSSKFSLKRHRHSCTVS
ncbi:hypothetical protein PVAND_008224 [Polypedilum vanderplanki]|uniref:Uncharacterized protein n=1 Tax=Polypedilum vanderplanki TaxID=319348 RepID=A0A9J6C9C3_POLVA|nr:hypothetical protein PVAND_008224 [Polypedilum vanderplanki]